MANSSTVDIDTKTAENILREINMMKKSLELLQKKVMKLFPAKYGSDLWWEKAEKEADEDIKAGRVYKLTSIDDLDKPINKLSQWK